MTRSPPPSFLTHIIFLSHSFSGAPISLLERDRMCGEFFVLPAGEDAIHIFSADSDRFVKLSKDTVRKAALNSSTDATGRTDGKTFNCGSGKAALKPNQVDILIFRPFQTWTMASAILCKAGSELGNTFRKYMLLFALFVFS